MFKGIDSVDVQSGGTMGGTRITLTGTNLDASADYPLEVYIGGETITHTVTLHQQSCTYSMIPTVLFVES